MSEKTSKRKDDHIRIVREKDVESGGAGFEDIVLTHNALPEINKEEIDTSCELLGNELKIPLLIDSMTGGNEQGKEINRNLAAAAEECGIGMGVGSQRAALEDESLEETYSVVREVAPSAFIYGNIGVVQLKKYNMEKIERSVEMIDADALAVHLNFIQEAVQPEGDVNARGCLEAIKNVKESLSVPIMVKETGCGISQDLAEKLDNVGVDIINVGGKGGTSWPYIESYRASANENHKKAKVGETFKDWGIPTAVSTHVSSEVHPCVIASGGIRTGLDIAKSLALGANAAAAATPFLEPGLKGKKEVINEIERMKEELEVSMLSLSSKNTEELSKVDVGLKGKVRDLIHGTTLDKKRSQANTNDEHL